MRQTCRQKLLFQVPEHWDNSAYEIDKAAVCSALQMLQQKEFTSILSHKNCSVEIGCNGANCFVVTCSSRHGHLQAACTQQTNISSTENAVPAPLQPLLKYMQQQMIPLLSDCIRVSTSMQDTFGYLSYSSDLTTNTSRNVDAGFYSNNSTTVSKLTDMLNTDTGHERIYPAAFAARLLQLGAIFCASAQGERRSLLHVGQAMVSDMSPDMCSSLYDSVKPEKHHVTLLLKGDSPQQRVHRINIAVRMLPPEHEFIHKHLAHVVGLNASLPTTGVMMLCGVRSNVAAAIYTNEDLASLSQLKLAFDSYMQV